MRHAYCSSFVIAGWVCDRQGYAGGIIVQLVQIEKKFPVFIDECPSVRSAADRRGCEGQ